MKESYLRTSIKHIEDREQEINTYNSTNHYTDPTHFRYLRHMEFIHILPSDSCLPHFYN